MKMYSARVAACAALIVAAFVPSALGQVVYNSQSRTISAQGEGSGDGNRTLTAPDFGPWNQTVVSHGSVGTGRATQVSSLQPWGASLNISTEVLGVASASGSCYFDFTPNEPLLVRISGSGEGFGTGFSLIGAGVSLSYTAHPDGSSWDVSALLQAGQKYSFTSGGAGSATTAANATAAASAPWSGLTGQGGVTSAAVGTGWQFLLNNNSVPGFRGGLRLADSGFLEITNSAQLASPNFARLSSSGAWSAVSDARLKTDVTGVDGQLAAALKLRPVKFRWKFDGREDMGLIAQEVREVFPTLVSGDEVEGILSVNYSQLSVVAIGAIQELKAENDRKQREIDDLKSRLERIEAKLK
ncbi:MAG: tail fiber domain-containing protein [Phycisphaerales bacterium]